MSWCSSKMCRNTLLHPYVCPCMPVPLFMYGHYYMYMRISISEILNFFFRMEDVSMSCIRDIIIQVIKFLWSTLFKFDCTNNTYLWRTYLPLCCDWSMAREVWERAYSWGQMLDLSLRPPCIVLVISGEAGKNVARFNPRSQSW